MAKPTQAELAEMWKEKAREEVINELTLAKLVEWHNEAKEATRALLQNAENAYDQAVDKLRELIEQRAGLLAELESPKHRRSDKRVDRLHTKIAQLDSQINDFDAQLYAARQILQNAKTRVQQPGSQYNETAKQNTLKKDYHGS